MPRLRGAVVRVTVLALASSLAGFPLLAAPASAPARSPQGSATAPVASPLPAPTPASPARPAPVVAPHIALALLVVDGGGGCRAGGGAPPVPRDPTDALQLRLFAEYFDASSAAMLAARVVPLAADGHARADVSVTFPPELVYVGVRASRSVEPGKFDVSLALRRFDDGTPYASERGELVNSQDLVLVHRPDEDGPCLVATLTAFDGTTAPSPAFPSPAAARRPPGHFDVPMPRLIAQQQPTYPLRAAQERRHGEVVVELVVDEHGRVPLVEIVRYPDEGEDLVRATVRAVHRWLFAPARRGGETVASTVTVVLRFRLHTCDQA